MDKVMDDLYTVHQFPPTVPPFGAAWSQEESVIGDDEPRSRKTTAALVVFLGVVVLVTFWLVTKLESERNSSNVVEAQQVTQKSCEVGVHECGYPAVPEPQTFVMPDVPDVVVIDRDTRYVNLLGNRGVVVNNKAGGVESARDLCQAKRDGYSQQQMIAAVLQMNSNLAPNLAPVVVSTAIETYCP